MLSSLKEDIYSTGTNIINNSTDNYDTRIKYGLLSKNAVPGYGRPRKFKSILDKEEGLLRANVKGEFHSIDDESNLEFVVNFRQDKMHCSISDENYHLDETARMIKNIFRHVKYKRLSSIPKVVDRLLGISACPHYLLADLEERHPRGITKEEKNTVFEHAKRLWPKKCNEIYLQAEKALCFDSGSQQLFQLVRYIADGRHSPTISQELVLECQSIIRINETSNKSNRKVFAPVLNYLANQMEPLFLIS